MIECENTRCPIGWFHPRCVGIKDEELDNTGNWFCSEKCQVIQETQDKSFSKKSKKKIKLY